MRPSFWERCGSCPSHRNKRHNPPGREARRARMHHLLPRKSDSPRRPRAARGGRPWGPARPSRRRRSERCTRLGADPSGTDGDPRSPWLILACVAEMEECRGRAKTLPMRLLVRSLLRSRSSRPSPSLVLLFALAARHARRLVDVRPRPDAGALEGAAPDWSSAGLLPRGPRGERAPEAIVRGLRRGRHRRWRGDLFAHHNPWIVIKEAGAPCLHGASNKWAGARDPRERAGRRTGRWYSNPPAGRCSRSTARPAETADSRSARGGGRPYPFDGVRDYRAWLRPELEHLRRLFRAGAFCGGAADPGKSGARGVALGRRFTGALLGKDGRRNRLASSGLGERHLGWFFFGGLGLRRRLVGLCRRERLLKNIDRLGREGPWDQPLSASSRGSTCADRR